MSWVQTTRETTRETFKSTDVQVLALIRADVRDKWVPVTEMSSCHHGTKHYQVADGGTAFKYGGLLRHLTRGGPPAW